MEKGCHCVMWISKKYKKDKEDEMIKEGGKVGRECFKRKIR